MKRVLFCIFLAFLIAYQSLGQTPLANIQRRLNYFLTGLEGFDYSGAVLITRRGRVILRKGYGMADRSKQIPNRAETMFDIGSIAKTFTAAAILQLDEAGKLKISDPIGKFLKTAPKDKASITIEQVLSHTSGLRDNFGTYEEIDKKEALDRVLQLPLGFTPGSAFKYSNGGYVVLAAVVEAASGSRYQEYVTRNIFQRLGMKRTLFWGKGISHVPVASIAHGYDQFAEVVDPTNRSGDTWFDLGGGMVLSTIDDLHKWVAALQAARILSRRSIDRMFTPAAPEGPLNRGRYGFGWYIKQGPYGKLYHHGGDSPGFGADIQWYKDQDVIIISLCNIRHDWFPTHIRADGVLADIVFGAPYRTPPSTRAGSSKAILGTYVLSSGGRLEITTYNGHSVIGAEGQDAVTLLTGADEQQQHAWGILSERTRIAFEGIFRDDLKLLDEASGGNQRFRQAVVEEIRDFGKDFGNFKQLKVLGTYPPGFPNYLATLLKFEFEKGQFYYLVEWNGDRIATTSKHPVPIAATTTLRYQSQRIYAAWNIVSGKGVQIWLNSPVGDITIFRDGRSTTARRIGEH